MLSQSFSIYPLELCLGSDCGGDRLHLIPHHFTNAMRMKDIQTAISQPQARSLKSLEVPQDQAVGLHFRLFGKRTFGMALVCREVDDKEASLKDHVVCHVKI